MHTLPTYFRLQQSPNILAQKKLLQQNTHEECTAMLLAKNGEMPALPWKPWKPAADNAPHEALSQPLSLPQPEYQEEQVMRRTGLPRPQAYLPKPQVVQVRGPHDYGRTAVQSGGFIPEQHMLIVSCLQDLDASPPGKVRAARYF